MITSRLQEAELERDKYKNAINKVADIMSWDDYDIEEKYWQIYEFVQSMKGKKRGIQNDPEC
tara:strand:- start:761 stop:946 length:186 start_codon:yes stop_codon:yes gene_type:complete